MVRTVKAVQLDTRSIQKYIFSSNKLKTNVGASYLVSKIYDEMENILIAACEDKGLKMPKENWRDYDDIKMEQDESIQCEIAYVGGGNMIILFDEKTDEEFCRSLIGEWTRKLLSFTPGLSTGCAVGELVLGDAKQFEESSKKMYQQLKQNQNSIFPNVDLPYTGLTVECKLSGKTATTFASVSIGEKEDYHYVADSELAKINAAKDANREMKDRIKSGFALDNSPWNFTDEIEKLGQKTGDEYIAVIHIDGNDMGVRFSGCKTLGERKRLSKEVAEYTGHTFIKLVESIVDEYSHYFDSKFVEGGMLELKNVQESILPIRPVIIGGDDITFVCPAKCGLIYAKRFIEHLQKIKLGDDFFHSCAGIAIVPTKYPFFRAYELAEELCGAAKKQARALKGKTSNAPGSSWLDFAIIHGEQSSDLERIRKEEYMGVQGSMHYGPYAVGESNEYREKIAAQSVDKLIKGSLVLKKLPKNKVKEMRNVIAKDSGEIHLFMEQLRYNNETELLNIDETMDRFKKELWAKKESGSDEKVTPYLDMIEMMDFVYDEKGGKQ